MLYHDMQRRLMIWMIPDGGEPDGPAINAKSGANAGYTARVVGSANELLEKIMIFDAQFDDLALEMVKIVIATQLEATGQPKDARIHFAQRAERQCRRGAARLRGRHADRHAHAALPREPLYSNMQKAAEELASRSPAARQDGRASTARTSCA